MHPRGWAPRRADEVWAGVNDSDIITACRLVLFQCPDADRSSIVPALRGLPRFPCVRNHPPTCSCRQGPKTMKLYTESLWAAGRVLMKDSVTVERITNCRLRDSVRYTHCRDTMQTYTHTSMQVHTQGRQTYTLCHATVSHNPDSRANGSWCLGVGGEIGCWDRWMIGGGVDGC